MIKLLALENCSNCKKMIQELENNRISYAVTYCEKDEALCDYVEFIIESSLYPIVLDLDSNNKIQSIYYIATKYEGVGNAKYKDNIKIMGLYSLDSLIDFVINN